MLAVNKARHPRNHEETAIPAKANLATTEDLLRLETRLDKRMDQVRYDLKEDLLKLENKIILWMGGMLVVSVSVLAVLMKIL